MKKTVVTIPKELLDELDREVEVHARRTKIPAAADEVIKRYAGKVSWVTLANLISKCFGVPVTRTSVMDWAVKLGYTRGKK